MGNSYPFSLIELPYQYDSLQPYIDAQTVDLHYNKHYRKYVDTLNSILSNYSTYQTWSLERLILNNDELPSNIQKGIKDNAGGVYNHRMYFYMMKKGSNQNIPLANLKEAIIRDFGSLETFYKLFETASTEVFGSGYSWLILDENMKLRIVKTSNQDVPLNVFHILLIDVWEHSYYLKYKNKRKDYITNWFALIDWEKAEQNYNNAINYLI